MEPLLKGVKIWKKFGEFAAVKELDFEIFPGEVFGIAGPNGAGKSTLFNVISGVPYSASSGKILFLGKEIQRLKPDRIFRLGIARTFQIPTLFPTLTYFENTKVGAVFGNPGVRAQGRIHKPDATQLADAALRLVGLEAKRDVLARDSSLFDMKRLMIASALSAKPKLLLLDEPIGGLNESETDETIALIRRISKEGLTVVLIEHVMRALLTVSQRIMMLHHGEKIAEGPPSQIARDPIVVEAYLGQEYQL